MGDETAGPGSGLKSRGVLMAWSPSVGTVEPSDTESIESRESAKSRDTSPTHSPIVSMKTFQNYPASEVRRDDKMHSNIILCLSVFLYGIPSLAFPGAGR